MRKSMSAWIRRGSVILLTMLLFLTAAVAENAQTPILIDGVRVAFFDADGNLLTPKAENGLLYVPLQAFCENMGLSAEVQGQSVAVDGTRIGMFDEAGNFLTPVQMDGVDYVPLAPFCNALGIQIAEENGGFSVTRKKAEQPAAETKAQTGKIALTPYNFGDYFSYSVRETNVKMTGMQVSGDGFFPGNYEVDYVLTCEARSVFEIENVSFQLVGKPRGFEMEDVVIYADMPASGSLNQTVHKSGDLLWTRAPEKEEASLKDVTLNDVSGCLIVNDQEKADTVNLASFQRGEMLLQAEEYDEAKKIFVSLIKIDYPNAQEKYDEAEVKKEETYQKAIALEEAGEYNQAILIYEKLGDYKDCMERIEKVKIELRYQEAVKEEEEENYSGAFQIYEELGDYKDSIARGSFCVKKYQALNRVAKTESDFGEYQERITYNYAYDEQGFPQSATRNASIFWTEVYTLDSDGFILTGKRETKYEEWRQDNGWYQKNDCTCISDVVYNEYEDDIFWKSIIHCDSDDTQSDRVNIELYEYEYDENGDRLTMTDNNKSTLEVSRGKREYRYVYDEYGRIKTRTEYLRNEIIDNEKYGYGDDGLLQQVKHFNSSGKCTQTDTYTYVYYGTERVRTEEGLAEHRERMNQLIEEAQKEPEKTYTTLKPGSNGQEVLDARMKLYELGYFKKKPTQTEYTDSMADYVKKFEKDYGLTQDGVLSPEDQEVLFGL